MWWVSHTEAEWSLPSEPWHCIVMLLLCRLYLHRITSTVIPLQTHQSIEHQPSTDDAASLSMMWSCFTSLMKDQWEGELKWINLHWNKKRCSSNNVLRLRHPKGVGTGASKRCAHILASWNVEGGFARFQLLELVKLVCAATVSGVDALPWNLAWTARSNSASSSNSNNNNNNHKQSWTTPHVDGVVGHPVWNS